jgi:hypothetical protein
MQTAVEQTNQEEQSAQIEAQPEPIQPQQQPGEESGEIENPKEHIETTSEPDRIELQPEPVVHFTSEDPEEHLETSDKLPVEKVQTQPLQTGNESPENPKGHRETTDESVPFEPKFQPPISQQTQEELEDEDDARNEETQKLPRIQIAQKHASARRPTKQNDV